MAAGLTGGLRRAAPWLAGLLLVYAVAAVMRRDDPPYRLDNEAIWALVAGSGVQIDGPDHRPPGHLIATAASTASAPP